MPACSHDLPSQKERDLGTRNFCPNHRLLFTLSLPILASLTTRPTYRLPHRHPQRRPTTHPSPLIRSARPTISMSSPKPIFSNLFANLPTGEPEEVIETLAKTDNIVIERIISEGQTSAEWYDQEQAEFCAVLRGAADLLFEHDPNPVRMNPGDWCIIPAHCKHKVSWTDTTQQTIWLAFFWKV